MPRQSKRIVDELLEFTANEMGKLQVRALQALTTATPVDTGFARGAWSPSVTEPVEVPSKAPADKSLAAQQGAANLGANLQKARAIRTAYKVANGPIYISNNVPYIGRLNGGTSAQAPARFVERAIERAVRASG